MKLDAQCDSGAFVGRSVPGEVTIARAAATHFARDPLPAGVEVQAFAAVHDDRTVYHVIVVVGHDDAPTDSA